jgi:hypothetical protein
MKKLLLLLVISWIPLVFIQAQLQVTATQGGYLETQDGSVSWTLGETVIETFSAKGQTLYQGFQQCTFYLVPVGVAKELTFEISAYPNPVTEYVALTVGKTTGIHFRIYDLDGKLLKIQNINNKVTFIEFNSLKPATYILKIFDGENEVRTFKIIKL